MTPQLRKQLFERWKELSENLSEPQPFDYFMKHLSGGLVHVQMDGVEALFGHPHYTLPYVCENIIALYRHLIPPE